MYDDMINLIREVDEFRSNLQSIEQIKNNLQINYEDYVKFLTELKRHGDDIQKKLSFMVSEFPEQLHEISKKNTQSIEEMVSNSLAIITDLINTSIVESNDFRQLIISESISTNQSILTSIKSLYEENQNVKKITELLSKKISQNLRVQSILFASIVIIQLGIFLYLLLS
jgi:hypothetical protein